MVTKPRPFANPTISIPPQVFGTNAGNAPGAVLLEEIQPVAHLLGLGQLLCGQVHGAANRLCQEVRLVTQERAQLLLGRRALTKGAQLPPSTLITLPVQFGHLVYGALCIAFDVVHPEQPAISLPIAQLLAQTCSWLLYAIEQSTFLQGQCQQLNYQVHKPLTKREREVLALMCRGFGQEAIAEMLSIASATVGKHRQHIYEQLGVHCERDALLAAYHVGLFSIIEESLP
jgi:DNA-binding CsgD family transcriptional regulator